MAPLRFAMNHGIHVEFADAKQDRDLIHRIRNFAEDLERELNRDGLGTVLNANTATDRVAIAVVRASLIGASRKVIVSELKRHNLDGSASVMRGLSASDRP